MLRDTGCTTVCISNKFADQIGSTAHEENGLAWQMEKSVYPTKLR